MPLVHRALLRARAEESDPSPIRCAVYAVRFSHWHHLSCFSPGVRETCPCAHPPPPLDLSCAVLLPPSVDFVLELSTSPSEGTSTKCVVTSPPPLPAPRARSSVRPKNRRERAQIGQDLFSGQAAVPLQFPASFTFVFRAFTTLDGIGKTLDKGYDLTKIAGPYLKELLDLKDGNAYVSYLKGLQKKLGERERKRPCSRSPFLWSGMVYVCFVAYLKGVVVVVVVAVAVATHGGVLPLPLLWLLLFGGRRQVGDRCRRSPGLAALRCFLVSVVCCLLFLPMSWPVVSCGRGGARCQASRGGMGANRHGCIKQPQTGRGKS